MRNHDERVRIVLQVVFQPVARFNVQVVGGFVEQEEIGPFKEQFAERNPHLPAAGELFGGPPPIVFLKPEAIEHHAHLRLDVVAIAGGELILEAVEPFGDGVVLRARRIEFGHRNRERLHLLLHGLHVVEHTHAFGKHAAAAQGQTVLRQVPDGHALGELDGAVVEGFHAAEDLQQRRFAGAVPADEAGTLLRRDQPGDIFKKQFRTEALAGKV